MIAIIDYGMGNLRSVENALDFIGAKHVLVRDPAGVAAADKVILPGVGAFQQAMASLARLGLADAVRSAASGGKPLLGICLGMQLLAETGEEGGLCPGLGLVSGTVRRLDPGPALRVPHMGFNEVELASVSALFEGIEDGSHFYFAHSYYLACPDEVVIARATHGRRFAAAVANGNVLGAQFHPEKSQSHGLRLLQNFCGNRPC